MFDNSQFFSGAQGFYPLTIDQSLRFNDDDSAYLSRTPATAGDQDKWTWSGWVKRANVDTESYLFSAGTLSTELFYIQMRSNSNSNVIGIVWRDGSTTTRTLVTTASYRDPSAWYHIVLSVDTTQASDADKMRLYVNGELVTSFSADSRSTLSASSSLTVNRADLHTLGRYAFAASGYADCYMTEVHFTDGTAYTADAFGEFKSGVWVAKSPSVTYGTNGFYLDFANSADIGNDVSGEGNDWTPNNFTASDVVLDSPTNNFAVLNNIYKGEQTTHTLYQGNLRWESTGDDFLHKTFAVSSGKWYWEGYYETANGTNLFLGVRPTNATNLTGATYYRTSGGEIYKEGTLNQSSITALVQTDVVGIAFNADDGEMSWYINGSQIGSTVTGMTISESLAPFVGNGNSSGTKRVIFNFGQDSTFAGNTTAGGNSDANGIGDFKYAPPSGFNALSTANLPDPVIDPAQDASPEDYFNTVLWTGDGTSPRNITSVGFEPSLVWWKTRNQSYDHRLYDQVRGTGKRLGSNSTAAESTTTELTAFNSDGFTLGNGAASAGNGSGETMVAWNWKANGSGVTNTDGSITSTVSANTTSGFSIVSYTGTGSNATVGHGLNSAPDLIIAKNRDTTNNWTTFHNLDTDIALFLNSNSASASGASFTAYWTNTAPTTSVFSVGTNANTNGSGNDMIAYVFSSVEGFSKFGSYTGNGSADGPFVYTGFRPAFVMIKRTDASGYNWIMFDSRRDPDNIVQFWLYPNLADAEATANRDDICSNGFKIRQSGAGINASGGTYIYMAFAENPFKYSNAR